MPRRNVVIESARQRRQRILRNERAAVMGSLYDELETNQTRRNEIATQMHDLQHELDMLKIDAGRIAERIEEENHYYHQGELDLVQWPADRNTNPTPTTRAETPDPKPETPTEWNSTTPAVPCFIERHPRGTPAHLITECEIFRRYTVSDRALSNIRLNLSWGCVMPRYFIGGRLHNGDECPHPRHCRRCRSARHHEALCGAPLVTCSAWEKARQAGLLIQHQ